MAHCPCFSTKKKNRSSRNEEIQARTPPVNRRASATSSSVGTNAGSQQSRNSLIPNDDGAKGNAKTFTYRELAAATNNFRQDTRLGEGGFGTVYKGQLEATGEVLAVKQLNHSGVQGDKEFLVEVLMLSLLRHPNLVTLIGYCAEGEQRLLVYEFMSSGSLEYHLHDITPNKQPLDWNTRMKIAAGAAKGLNYLHNGAKPPVILRDLKSSNILLNEGFEPKLSDFGLAKFGPNDDKSHVSTRVMGTHGYCAPEYAGTGRLTMKSDVYSFGVVLLEIISGQRAYDNLRAKGKELILEWARPMLKQRITFIDLADARLEGKFSGRIFHKAVEVALMCLRENPQKRPTMTDVEKALNYLASASEQYDPNADHSREQSNSEGQGQDEDSQSISSGPGQTSEEATLLRKTPDRDRAVAEAKMWGEAYRQKKLQRKPNEPC